MLGDNLHDMHRAFGKLDNEDEYPIYKPHITISYVRSGSCRNLTEKKPFAGEKIKVDEIVFVNTDKKRTTISL